MFERFTEGAKKCMALSRKEALKLGHDSIGTEHILLGLLGLEPERFVAPRVWANLGIATSEIRRFVLGHVKPGGPNRKFMGSLPFTQQAKKVLEQTMEEADALGVRWIATEHVLLGLLREGEGQAARVLIDLGIDLERARAEVLRLRA